MPAHALCVCREELRRGAEYIYEEEIIYSARVGIHPIGISLSKLPQDLLARIVAAARIGGFEVAELISEQAAAKLGRQAEQFGSDNLIRLVT